MSMIANRRNDLLHTFRRAIGAVHGTRCVHEYIIAHKPAERIHVAAIGKAAAAMFVGAMDALGAQVERGLVITRYGHLGELPRRFPQTITMEAGHPEPDAASLRAGRALVEFVSTIPRSTRAIILLSGGASALAEVLPVGITLDDLQRVSRWLLGSGLDIARTNAVRKGLSCIKGGRLARHLRGGACDVLVMSDVRGDDLSVIGSGPLYAEALATNRVDNSLLPAWLVSMLSRGEAPPSTTTAFNSIYHHVIANNAKARHAAAATATELGYTVHDHVDEIYDDVARAARIITESVNASPVGFHVWGGETTVRLPHDPGFGGRNQHLALSIAVEIEGREDIAVLVAGTDGTDGNSQYAGAIVDGGTVARGRARGVDAYEALLRANSAAFLSATGDAISTGPTGTNVMDLVFGIRISKA